MGSICFKTNCAGRGDPGVVIRDEAKIASKFTASSGVSSTKEVDPSGGDEVDASATSVPTPSCLEFCSSRTESMIARRSENNELEFRKAHSRVHWSELSHEGATAAPGRKESMVDHRQHFKRLQKDVHWGRFCNAVSKVVVGKKLGEGAQADIYEAEVKFVKNHCWSSRNRYRWHGYVVKVMKGECALEDLQRQWPHGVGTLKDRTLEQFPFFLCGALVKEPVTHSNKFSFVMPRHWGDLRRLIDLRMVRNSAKGPPFSIDQAKTLMRTIAFEMDNLHERGIIHKDLKASNVLVSHSPLLNKECDLVSSSEPTCICPFVSDWECSVGVVGTGFWRAPEILLQLKNRTPSSEVEFNEKVDVYSFAMTCYEIATGITPFEGVPIIETRDAILNGAQLELPHDLDPCFKIIFSLCWDLNPSLRPTFKEILQLLNMFQ